MNDSWYFSRSLFRLFKKVLFLFPPPNTPPTSYLHPLSLPFSRNPSSTTLPIIKPRPLSFLHGFKSAFSHLIPKIFMIGRARLPHWQLREDPCYGLLPQIRSHGIGEPAGMRRGVEGVCGENDVISLLIVYSVGGGRRCFRPV